MGEPVRRLRPVDDKFDPFAPAKDGYDPQKLYPGLPGGKQQSELLSVRVPDFVLGMISELVASKQIPEYKTTSDFVRDRLVHGVHAVAEMLDDGKLKSDLTRFIALQDVRSIQIEMNDIQEIVEGYTTIFDKAWQDKDHVLLADVLSKADTQVENLRPAHAARLQSLIDLYRERLKGLQ